MPIIYQQQVNNDTKIGVWHITEPDFFFLHQVSLQRNITHPHKRLQHLAGRYLLKVLYPQFPTPLILIADTRKPFLEDEAYHFSISHCGNYAAAIVSTQNRVGIDIEIPHPKIVNLQHKFLSTYEQALIKNIHLHLTQSLTMAWSIKEAMFKWYGKGELDFKNHLQITSLHKIDEKVIATCSFLKETHQILQITSINLGSNNLSWVVT